MDKKQKKTNFAYNIERKDRKRRENIMLKKIKNLIKKRNNRGMEQPDITMEELKKLEKEGAILLDVRSPQEYKEGHLNGAISLPEYEIKENVETILKNKKEIIIVYCSSGSRSKKAQKELIEMGYETVYNLLLENALQ